MVVTSPLTVELLDAVGVRGASVEVADAAPSVV